MNQDISSFVERYQLIFEKDPNSKVFAPLAEAYRRMGLVDEAIDLAEGGVKKHPNFSSGRVALGKCYSQKGNFDKAVEHLRVAVDLSPENILAHQVLADCFVKMGKLGEALQSYKMVLFLNPNDAKIASLVQKLEKEIFMASKNENIKEEFAMEKLHQVRAPSASSQKPNSKAINNQTDGVTLDRELALLDTRLDRGQWKEAKEQLAKLKKTFPEHPELLKREKQYNDLQSEALFFSGEWISPLKSQKKTSGENKKVKLLQELLARVETRKRA